MSKSRVKISRERMLETRIFQLEKELKRIAEAAPGVIDIQTIVSDKTGTGMVRLTWGQQIATLSAGEARDHAIRMLEAANAAETDAFVHDYFRSKGVDRNGAAIVLQEFREYREERKRKDFLPPEKPEVKDDEDRED